MDRSSWVIDGFAGQDIKTAPSELTGVKSPSAAELLCNPLQHPTVDWAEFTALACAAVAANVVGVAIPTSTGSTDGGVGRGKRLKKRRYVVP